MYTLHVLHRDAEPYTGLVDAVDVEHACREECTTEAGDYASEYIDTDGIDDQADPETVREEMDERLERAALELTRRMFTALWRDGERYWRMPASGIRYRLEETDEE
jgi:hypothetical protein